MPFTYLGVSLIPSSDIQPPLEGFAGGFLVLIESVGIDVQRRGGLGVTQETRHCRHVRAVCDQQTGVAVPERMHVQLFRNAVLLQDQLEPPGEGAGVIGS